MENTHAFLWNDIANKMIRIVSAEEAAKIDPKPGQSFRCMGIALDPVTKKRKKCRAELTPYAVTVAVAEGKTEERWYFREYQEHDDGSGEGLKGKDGKHKGHILFCEFGTPSAMKISKEYLEEYETPCGAMAEAVAWCRMPPPAEKKKENCPDGVVKQNSERNENKANETNVRTIIKTGRRSSRAKRGMEFWCSAVNNGGSNDVMTPENYDLFRNRRIESSGYKVHMAGICPNYSAVFSAITEQHPALAKENITILSDPFFGDPIIYVLVDKLPSDGSWMRKSKRIIDSKSVRDFVFKGYMEVEEKIGDKTVKKKVFNHEHGPYFAVMSDWRKLSLVVAGNERLALVGEIYALGAQLEFFQPNDLVGVKDNLRFWKKKKSTELRLSQGEYIPEKEM